MIFITRGDELVQNVPQTFIHFPALVTEIVARVGNVRTAIGIDGWTGVGKTTLAKELSNATGWIHFDLDDFLNEDRGVYIDALRIDEIVSCIGKAKGNLIVSGVCLLSAFEKLRLESIVHVYIKRMASWGWADEFELDGSLPEIEGASGEGLRSELRRYHFEFRPHLESDFEFHRPS